MTKAQSIALIRQYCETLRNVRAMHDVQVDAAGMYDRWEAAPGDKDKAMRWLGYIQGVCVASGIFTRIEVQQHSRDLKVTEL